MAPLIPTYGAQACVTLLLWGWAEPGDFSWIGCVKGDGMSLLSLGYKLTVILLLVVCTRSCAVCLSLCLSISVSTSAMWGAAQWRGPVGRHWCLQTVAHEDLRSTKSHVSEFGNESSLSDPWGDCSSSQNFDCSLWETLSQRTLWACAQNPDPWKLWHNKGLLF